MGDWQQEDEPPLAGLRVLDLSRLLPGPFCTLILSDLGAAVDKLEDPNGGDSLRGYPPLDPLDKDTSRRFLALNRDKRSFCLDLKRDAGRSAFERLVPRYDVVIESFRPGVLDRLGLGPARLLAIHPRLVVCSITGYGQTGPLRSRAGHDLNYVALGGLLGVAEAAGTLSVPPAQTADLAGGSLYGAVGILAALLHARSTGRGRHLDVSMCEGATSFLLPEIHDGIGDESEPDDGSRLLTGGAARYGVYRTKDGRHLSVAPIEPKFWVAFNAAIGRPTDAAELDATKNNPAEEARIAAEIQAIVATRTRDEWEVVFSKVDSCVEPVLSPEELPHHPQHLARELFFRLGERTYARTPLGRADGHRAPPRLGEHTDQILSEAGFSTAEIAALRQAKVTK